MMVKDFNISPMVELPWQQPWMRSRPSNSRKVMGKTYNTSHPPRECPAWGKKCHKCGNKNHFNTCCRSKQKSQQVNKPFHGRSTLRGPKGKGRWSRSRSRSRSATWSAHSIELNSFQDHPELHGSHSSDVHESQPKNSMGVTPFKTIRKAIILSRRHFTLFTGSSW